MKKTFWMLLTVILLGIVSCGKSRDQRVQEIKDYEKKLNLESTSINEETGKNLINYYTKFSKDFPKDELTPAYLFRAAEVAMNIQDQDEAIRLLDKIITDYPGFTDTPDACFMKGFVYETVSEDKDKAIEAYKIFLEKYPEHELAKDAQLSIDMIDLSPEDLIQKFIMEGEMQDTIAA